MLPLVILLVGAAIAASGHAVPVDMATVGGLTNEQTTSTSQSSTSNPFRLNLAFTRSVQTAAVGNGGDLEVPVTHPHQSFPTLKISAAIFAATALVAAKITDTFRKRAHTDELSHILTTTTVATALTVAAVSNAVVVEPAAAITLPIGEQQLYRDAWRAVRDAFIDKSYNGQDWDKVRDEALAKPLASREETYAEIRSSLELLGDPFTRLLDPPQYDNIKRRLTGKLDGVGLEIVPVTEKGTRLMKVVDRTYEGPAYKAGIMDDDLITAVDGEPIGDQSQWVIADKIVGKRKSDVVLTVVTPGQDTRDVAIQREEVVFQSVKSGLCEGVPNQVYQEKPLERLGYIRVPSFNFSTASEFNRALKEMTKQGADAVVIDLRNDTGGSLNAAYEMANSILPSGEIVRVVSGDGTVTSAQVRGRAQFADIPVALLVNDFTASSSEVLAAGLKAADRAVIAGQQTFGKGIIQDIKVLADGSALFVTKERYLTPLNEEIDKVGIAPTVAVDPKLLDVKKGLRTEPTQFCTDMVREAPPLFSGAPPPPPGPHGDVDLYTLSAFC